MSHNPHPYNRAIPAGYELRQKKPWYKKAGCIVPLIIVAVFILLMAGCMAVFGKAADEVNKEMNADKKVTYEVDGDAVGASIIYTTANLNTSQENQADLPWKKEVPLKGSDAPSVNVTTDDNGGKITCRIRYNGKVISENTSSGSFANANCHALGSDLK